MAYFFFIALPALVSDSSKIIAFSVALTTRGANTLLSLVLKLSRLSLS